MAEWISTTGTPLPSLTGDDDAEAFLLRVEEIAGDALVIGFGEPDHGFREFAVLRNMVFKRLVEKRGFRCLTLETGILEARLVDEFITDVTGAKNIPIGRVLAEGFTHGMGEWRETRDLVEFARDFNIAASRTGGSLVRWGGKDLSVRGDTLTVPLVPVTALFARVGSEASLANLNDLAAKASAVTDLVEKTLFEKVGLRHIDPDHLDAVTSLSYDQLSDAERAAVGVEISKALDLLNSNSASWAAMTSADDLEWARTCLTVARQIWKDLETRILFGVTYGQTTSGGNSLTFLKRVFAAIGSPLPAMPRVKFSDQDFSPKQLSVFLAAREASRERHLADNVLALSERFGKVFNFAASSHLQTGRGLEDTAFSGSEGLFLREALGDRYVAIGGTAGAFAAQDSFATLRAEQAARPDSVEQPFLEAMGGKAGSGMLVDLCSKALTPEAKAWTQSPHPMWIGPLKFMNIPAANFDALYCVVEATPGQRI
jgi:erythromycin esterase-like protein